MHKSTIEGVVGRFAPTPSGGMHLGNVLCALLSYVSARKSGGGFLLRIEDLDTLRAPRSFAEEIIADLRWLGLDWDADPLWQSERSDVYAAYEKILDDRGITYPCFCSRAELHAASAPHLSDGSYRYDGRCARLSPREAEERLRFRPACRRVRVPDDTVVFTDGVAGEQSQNLQKECGDFILRRSDGVFAYQLAVVADDGESGVTQVVRGADLLSSTARQIWLFRTFGFTEPQYYHIPLLCDVDGRRLSKRDGDCLGALRHRLSPQQIIGALSYACGISDTCAPLSLKDCIALFDWKKVYQDSARLPVDFLA